MTPLLILADTAPPIDANVATPWIAAILLALVVLERIWNLVRPEKMATKESVDRLESRMGRVEERQHHSDTQTQLFARDMADVRKRQDEMAEDMKVGGKKLDQLLLIAERRHDFFGKENERR